MSQKCEIFACPGYKARDMIVCNDHARQIWASVQHAAMDGHPIPMYKPAPPEPPDSWIYFLKLDAKIKIGWTSNYIQRMRAYPPHAEVLVRHHGTRADERDLHRSFKPSRAAGREWYHPTPELMRHIERIKAEQIQVLMERQAAAEAEVRSMRFVRPQAG